MFEGQGVDMNIDFDSHRELEWRQNFRTGPGNIDIGKKQKQDPSKTSRPRKAAG
jgi:hypothetical protein